MAGICLTAVFRFIGGNVGRSLAEPESVEKWLVEGAESINKQLPKTIDKDIRQDVDEAGPSLRYTHHYTVVTVSSKYIDKASSFLLNNAPALKSKTCSDQKSQAFFKNKVTVCYSYRTSDGYFIAKIEVTPKDCGYTA